MNTRTNTTLKLLLALFALLIAPAATFAQESKEEAALQKRFKARYPELRQLKADGVIGETSEGYVDFVEKKDPKAAKLVEAENNDRKALYKLLAEKEGATVEQVARVSAKRNFERARAGEYLKEGGKWKKKEAPPKR